MIRVFVFLVILSFLLITSCKEQNVITKLDANNGVLDVSFDTGTSFGNIFPSTLHQKTITLRNSGGLALTSIQILGISGDLKYSGDTVYPGIGGTCSNYLMPGETCTIILDFYSENEYQYSTNFQINYNDGITNKSKSFSISADVANAGSLIFAQGLYDNLSDVDTNRTSSVRFPRIALGATQEQIITLANNGGRTLTFISHPDLQGDIVYSGDFYPGMTGTCGSTLAPSSVCTIVLAEWTSVIGQYNYNVSFVFDNGVTTATAPLQLSVDVIDQKANLIIFGPPVVNLGDLPQGLVLTKSIDIINNAIVASSNTTMSITNNSGFLTYTGTSGYPGLNGTCDDAQGAYEICSLEIVFDASTLGTYNEILTMNYDDNHAFFPANVTSTTSITAKVVTPADLTLNATYSLPTTTPNVFGPHVTTDIVNRIMSIENIGGYKARDISVSLINNPSGVISIIAGGTCGVTKTTLNPNDRCTVKLKSQSAATGDFSADLRISYDDGLNGGVANISYIIPITVSYVEASNLRFLPTSMLDFGEALIGADSPTRTVTLSNTSSGTATGINLDTTGMSPRFQYTGTTCGATLPGNSTCYYYFKVHPTVPGTLYSTLQLNYTDLLGSGNKALTLRAYPRVISVLSLRDRYSNPLANIDFKDGPLGKATSLSINIYNPGGAMTATNIVPSFSDPRFAVVDYATYHTNCTGMSNFNLAAGDSCSLEVTFTPDGAGPFPATFSISYYNGSATVVNNYSVTGTGTNSGLLEAVGATRFSLYHLGQTVSGNPKSFFINFENTGSADVSGFSANSLGSRFSWGASTCDGTIVPGGTCQIEVIFSPTSSGTYETWIDYTYFSSNNNKEFAFEVQAVSITPADLYINFTGPNRPTSYNFGNVPYLLTNYLDISINNTGAAPANNFSITLDQGSLTSFAKFATTCPANGATLNGGSGCTLRISYSPEDQTAHSAQVIINYDGYGNESLPITINLSGQGVDPLATFSGWYEIYAVSGASTGTVTLKWDAMVPQSAGVVVDGYKVYISEGLPLPMATNALTPYLVATINGTTFNDRTYTINNTPTDHLYYIAIRPTYLGRVIGTTDKAANIKIMTPPPHMALVHPYAVNKNVCGLMGIATDPAHELGCPFTGKGSKDGYYTFDRYLYVDRYELSSDIVGDPQNLPNEMPTEFINQILASTACNNVNLTFQGGSVTKRLLRRSESTAAAAWPAHFNTSDIEAREGGSGATYCRVLQDNPSATGSSADCVSRYGIYDLVGNLWEWNSDQINGTIGWTSSLDPENDELYGFILGGVVMLPDLVINLPCYSVALGFMNNYSSTVCEDGLKASVYPALFTNDFYWPPVSADLKAVRSGGGVGANGSFFARKAGRWVADFSTSLTFNTGKTGARCGFSLPFVEE